MCNLYNITIGPQAILDLTRAMTNRVGNLEPQDVYPDYSAPIVRQGQDGERELVRARWGMPSSKKAIFDATVKRVRWRTSAAAACRPVRAPCRIPRTRSQARRSGSRRPATHSPNVQPPIASDA